MNISCLFLLHKWDGCKCTRCGSTRNKNHNWDCWKCSRCGRATSEGEARFLKRTTDGDSEYVEARLKESPGLAFCKDIQGDTPLHLAAKQGHAPVARLLISHGANVNAKNRVADRPLHLATEGGHDPIAQLLIDHGAKVSVQNQQGDTPLHLAAQKDRPIAQMLLNKGADVNATNRRGDTPLCVAARSDAESAGSILVKAAKTRVLATIQTATSNERFGLPKKWDGDQVLLRALDVARLSGSHKMAADLLRLKGFIHREKARLFLARANMFAANHNKIIAQGDTPAGMNRSFAESEHRDAQEESRKAREADLAADSEIALIANADDASKPNAGES